MNSHSTDSSSGLQARKLAMQLLRAVLDDKKPLDDVSFSAAQRTPLPSADRAFAMMLAKTTLRRLAALDAVMAQLLHSPLKGRGAGAAHIIRLGLCQLMYLDVAPHAAVHTSVELAKTAGFEAYAKLVNASLQRFIREKATLTPLAQAAPILPLRLRQGWVAAYGQARVGAMEQVMLREPSLDITLRQASQAAHWATQLNGVVMADSTVRIASPKGTIEQLEGYAQGAWWVQDLAATLPIKMLGDVSDKTVLDCCAAPGGKTAQLAAMGAKVTAMDRSVPRLKRLRENMARLQMDVRVIQGDLLQWSPPQVPDIIVLDAPCSASGTLRRHPELALLYAEKNLPELMDLQRQMLHRTADWLAPGGQLLYCVCSLEPQEGPAQLTQFLANRKDMELLPLKPADFCVPEAITAEGTLRTTPEMLADSGGMDGFFAARVRKIG